MNFKRRHPSLAMIGNHAAPPRAIEVAGKQKMAIQTFHGEVGTTPVFSDSAKSALLPQNNPWGGVSEPRR